MKRVFRDIFLEEGLVEINFAFGFNKKLICLVVGGVCGEGLFGLFCVKRAVLVLAKAGEAMDEVVLRC